MAKAAANKNVKKTFPDEDKVIKAAFDLIAEKGLGKARLSAIAVKLKTPLPLLYAIYPTVESIIHKFLDDVDRRMMDAMPANPADMAKRDIYFDLLMTRFDALQAYRAGVVRWLQDLPKHPDLWIPTLKRWDQSLSLMLDIAQDSPLFPVKKIGLMAVYSAGLRAWMKDDTESLDKTMVAVDKNLGKADSFTRTFLQKKKA